MPPHIRKQTRSELLEALRQRYQQPSKTEKSQVLAEFVAVSGCQRQHPTRLLAATPRAAPATTAVDRRPSHAAVRDAPVVLREAADRICGMRLRAVLPGLLTALGRHGQLALDPRVRASPDGERGDQRPASRPGPWHRLRPSKAPEGGSPGSPGPRSDCCRRE